MVATEFHSYQEAEDPFEAEETLSLSDLPITGDSAQCDESYSKQVGDFNDDDDDGDFFEFISEDFSASTRATVEKDIIFCGKIINTYNESLNDVAKQSNTLHQEVDTTTTTTTTTSVLLPWIPNKSASKPAVSRNSSFNNSKNLRCDYSVGKVSLMRSATKSRWYLFMSGMASMRLPTEMELSDIKSRQSRRRSTAAAGGEVVVRKSKGKNLWLGKILKSLGLGCSNSKHTNDVVKSFVSLNLPNV